MPGCYEFMNGPPRVRPSSRSPSSAQPLDLNSVCAYWQPLHRGRTTVGYRHPPNEVNDNLLTYNFALLRRVARRPWIPGRPRPNSHPAGR